MRLQFIQNFIDKIRGKKKGKKLISITNAPCDGTYEILSYLHKIIEPKTYVEIGVNTGCSIVHANRKTNVIGIYPLDSVIYKLPRNIKMFFETSDAFFERKNISSILKNKFIDLAFIDGMHLFEYALRDFINIERHSYKDTVITLHDCIPVNAYVSSRDFHDGSWTGDVFKMVMILKKYRPDLKIYNYSNICVVLNADSKNTVLADNYDKILKEYMDSTYDDVKDNLNELISPIKKTQEEIKNDLRDLLKGKVAV